MILILFMKLQDSVVNFLQMTFIKDADIGCTILFGGFLYFDFSVNGLKMIPLWSHGTPFRKSQVISFHIPLVSVITSEI